MKQKYIRWGMRKIKIKCRRRKEDEKEKKMKKKKDFQTKDEQKRVYNNNASGSIIMGKSYKSYTSNRHANIFSTLNEMYAKTQC